MKVSGRRVAGIGFLAVGSYVTVYAVQNREWVTDRVSDRVSALRARAEGTRGRLRIEILRVRLAQAVAKAQRQTEAQRQRQPVDDHV